MSQISDKLKIGSQSAMTAAINRSALANFIANARADFIAARPNGFNLSSEPSIGFMGGVPQHWMRDWPTPFPLYIASAQGTTITDIDGNILKDLCLGDTGAMFGHAPDKIKTALTKAAATGLTAMLPSEDAIWVGAKLAQIFGLPFWQLALSASDANRFALRVARAISGRQKILVFDGAYHGAVDETTVELDINGRTIAKPSLWGSAFNPAENTVCIPFNDKDELESALFGGEIACIIMEPALTNCGIVPPMSGFLEFVLKTAKANGTLVLMDETHTLSSGYGGYCKTHGLTPDIFVAGKAIAGGVPCAVWGFSNEIKQKLDELRNVLPNGHSGVGTTLGGSLLSLTALKASLDGILTPQTFENMIASAIAFEEALVKLFDELLLEWQVIRIGARFEIVFSKQIPQNAAQMRAIIDHDIETALHLGLLNRGFLVTPFHNMVLCGPGLAKDTPIHFAQAMREILLELIEN